MKISTLIPTKYLKEIPERAISTINKNLWNLGLEKSVDHDPNDDIMEFEIDRPDRSNSSTPGSIEIFMQHIEEGNPGVVCFGREVYAIIGDPFSENIDSKIRAIKERDKSKPFAVLTSLSLIKEIYNREEVHQLWWDLLENPNLMNSIFGNSSFIRFPAKKELVSGNGEIKNKYPPSIIGSNGEMQVFSFYGDEDVFALQMSLTKRLHSNHTDIFDLYDQRGNVAIITSFNISTTPSIVGTNRVEAYELIKYNSDLTNKIFHRRNAGASGSYSIIDFTRVTYEKIQGIIQKIGVPIDDLNIISAMIYDELATYRLSLKKEIGMYELSPENYSQKVKQYSENIKQWRPVIEGRKFDLTEYEIELLYNNIDSRLKYASIIRRGKGIDHVLDKLDQYQNLKQKTI